MAIFSKNANRAALFGKQKLFKACCTPEVEECCYSTDPTPRPVCNCNNYETALNVNGVIQPTTAFLTLSASSDLPANIQINITNTDTCPIDITNISLIGSSPYIVASLPITPFVLAAGTSDDVFGFQLSELAGPGGYIIDYSYTICGFTTTLQLEIMLVS